MSDMGQERPPQADAMLDPRVIDPHEELISYKSMSAEELSQLTRVMVALRKWRDAEQRVSLKSRNQMKLNETDMKALRFLVVAQNQGILATPGALAEHLNISTASTTKLLDRLAHAGHVNRSPHPTDRRALVITITQSTHEEVREGVGRNHARRFEVATKLSPDEREVVIRFLTDLSEIGLEAEASASRGAEDSSH